MLISTSSHHDLRFLSVLLFDYDSVIGNLAAGAFRIWVFSSCPFKWPISMDRVVAAILPRKAYRASPRSSPSSPAEAEAQLSRIHDAAADDYDMAANRFPRRTSFALETMGFSNPGIGSTAGRTPQAQITASGFRDATYASSAVVFSRTSTPLSSSCFS